MSCCISIQLSWPKNCNGTTDETIAITMPVVTSLVSHDQNVMLNLTSIILTYGMQWCHCWHQWHHVTPMPVHHMNKNVMLHLFLNILTLGMWWCLWWWYWHHVMLMLVPMVSHDQKSPVAPHFNHHDLRNTMLPLMMLSPWCDIDASDITCPIVMMHLVSIALT